MRVPLTELWNDEGEVQAQCLGTIGKTEIESLLQSGATFVIADVGQPLLWTDRKAASAFWKSEAEPRIVDPRAKGFRLEDFPESYCYVQGSGSLRPAGPSWCWKNNTSY